MAERIFYKGHLVNVSSSNGYPTIWDGKKNVLLHRIVWEEHFGKIPNGYQVHHKNRNRKDWSIDNLEMLKASEHARHHALEHELGKGNKGKLKLYSSGFCEGAKKVVISKGNESHLFNSVTDTAKFLGVSKISDVSRVLTGKRKTIHGWRCEYA